MSTEKTFSKISAAVNESTIVGVIPNMQLSFDEPGYFMTDEQVANIEAALEANETAVADLATAQQSVETLTADLATTNQALTEANTALQTANARITELEAQEGKQETPPPPAGDQFTPSATDVNNEARQKELYEKVK